MLGAIVGPREVREGVSASTQTEGKEYEHGHGLLVAVAVETYHIMSDCAIRGRTPCCTEKERADASVRTAQQKGQDDLEFGLKVYMSAVGLTDERGRWTCAAGVAPGEEHVRELAIALSVVAATDGQRAWAVREG